MTPALHPSFQPKGQPRLDFRGFRILAWASYCLLNVLYLLACMQRTAIPGAVFNDLQGDLNLLGSQVTRLGSLYVYAYASSQVFAGMLVDRFGGKKMGIVGGILMGVGLTLFSRAETPAELYASRVTTAFGQAFIYLCVVKLAHLLFSPKQFGALIGFSMAIGFAGGILGTLPTQRIAQFAGWRPLFLAVGLCCLASAAAVAIALSSLRERKRKSGSVTWRTVANLFNEPGRFCFMTFDFWSFPAFFVLQAILGQKFIQDWLGYSPTAAAAFTMALTVGSMLTCIFGAPIPGLMGDRRKPVILLGKGLPVVSAIVMMAGIKFALPGWVFLVCFMAMSLNQLSSASLSALLTELTDSRTIAFSAAVRNFFPYVGSGFVGGICGAVLDRYAPAGSEAVRGVIHYPPEAYMRILSIMMVFALIGFAMALRIPETRGKHIFKA